MTPKEITRAIRENAIRRDDEGHFARELAFNIWRDETIFPQCVDRLIQQIGEDAK